MDPERFPALNGRFSLSRTLGLLILVAGLLVLPAAAQSTTVRLVFEGKDSGCPDGKSMCFVETTGNLKQLTPGHRANVLFKNTGSTRHMWMVTVSESMDAAHQDTQHHAAISAIEDVEPGMQGNASFTAPTNIHGLYFWCGEPGHEQLGMWILLDYAAPGAGEPTPAPPSLALVALVGAAVLMTVVRGRES